LALRNGPAPILCRLTDLLALRHDQQKSIEIEIWRFVKKWLRPVDGRFTPAVARFMQRFKRERHAGSGLARAGMGCDFRSYFLKPALACTY
jgi:hypothetical protein